jgi:hypothetical protein
MRVTAQSSQSLVLSGLMLPTIAGSLPDVS